MSKEKLNYANDYLVRSILSKNTEEAKELLKLIISSVTNIYPKEVKVENPINHKDNDMDKEEILDILVTDEKGYKYNIEIQLSILTNAHIVRFLAYTFETWLENVKHGIDYNNVKACIQIIFINDTMDDVDLINPYAILHKNKYKELLLEFQKIEILFVCMPNINNKEVLNDFEQLVYLFENNKPNDKMKMSKGVKYYMSEYIEFTKDELEYRKALRRQRDKMARNFTLQELVVTKQELNVAKGELQETKGELQETKGELQETKGELQETKGELQETKDELNDAYNKIKELEKLLGGNEK